jgi:Kef-type K+ transport system membrane component KefB
MPLVVGELLAGICLGPSLLGKYFPQLNEVVFTTKGHVGLVLNGISTVSVIMLLFAAGMEVEFSVIRQQSKTALKTSFVGLLSTLTLGYFAGNVLFPYFGDGTQSSQLVFSLFFATAMAITALPVIARTLMDLDLFKTKIGMIIIAAAMFDDVIGWILFSVVLGMMHSGTSSYEFLNTLGLTLLYAVPHQQIIALGSTQLKLARWCACFLFGLCFFGCCFHRKNWYTCHFRCIYYGHSHWRFCSFK